MTPFSPLGPASLAPNALFSGYKPTGLGIATETKSIEGNYRESEETYSNGLRLKLQVEALYCYIQPLHNFQVILLATTAENNDMIDWMMENNRATGAAHT